ncbi:hypothetical protein SH668x_002922 [Planctomicrobium sp. SH668]|uniref:hypothetical protein n=1 Tax=Planctomicrobium sp. SH668 TaxID=3448126 RepID=UPI003F5B6900
MPTSIGFWHFTSDDPLNLSLHPVQGGPLQIEATVELIEENSESVPGYYSATLATSIQGPLRARVLRDDVLIYDGFLSPTGTANSFIITSEFPRNLEVSSFSPAALGQLASQRILTVSAPMMIGKTLSTPLIRGDSYLAEHGRALEFSRSDFPDLPADSQVRLSAKNVDQPGVSFQLAGTILSGIETKVVRFQPTSAQSATWIPGKYRFDIQVTFPDGNSATFEGPNSFLHVIPDVTENV